MGEGAPECSLRSHPHPGPPPQTGEGATIRSESTVGQTLKIETDARGVATLTLTRAEKHNAMNAAMMAELTEAAATLGADPAVRVVMLASEGKSFSAGADLNWMRDQVAADRAGRIAEAKRLAAMLRALNEMPKPLIARVHGNAFGGGLGLISVCDVAIGVRRATLACWRRWSHRKVWMKGSNAKPCRISPPLRERWRRQNGWFGGWDRRLTMRLSMQPWKCWRISGKRKRPARASPLFSINQNPAGSSEDAYAAWTSAFALRARRASGAKGIISAVPSLFRYASAVET